MNSVTSLCLRRRLQVEERRGEKRAPATARSAASVDEEYACAVRTDSYTSLCDRVERHWSTGAARPPDYYSSLLLEPAEQEAVDAVAGRLPRLLCEFFRTSLLACNSCGALIDDIRRARASSRLLLACSSGGGRGGVVEQLRGFCRLGNPFPGEQIERAREAYDPLARRLMEEYRGAARRRQRLWRSVAAFFGGGGGACRGTRREEAQVGAAARGAFAVDRGLDTMRNMAKRVGEEIEQTREVIELAVEEEEEEEGEGEGGGVMVKELRRREGGLREQLAELEEHVLLCCLNINRARKMVLKELDI